MEYDWASILKENDRVISSIRFILLEFMKKSKQEIKRPNRI